jgi:hypothetical protein
MIPTIDETKRVFHILDLVVDVDSVDAAQLEIVDQLSIQTFILDSQEILSEQQKPRF